MTSVINYHNLSSLKQQKFIISCFWKSDVEMSVMGQNQGVARAVILFGSPKGESVF
jgi:hypothetical protein